MTKFIKRINLDKAQEIILELIRNGKSSDMTLDEIKDITSLSSSSAVFYKLKQLETKGYIRKDDNGNYVALENPLDTIYFFPSIGFAYCGHIKDSDFGESQIKEYIPFPTKEISITNSQDISKYFFTRAVGDSMQPMIKNGDLLLVKSQSDYNSNDSILLLHNGIPKIKKIIKREESYFLLSMNESISDLEIALKDELEIIGVVKKIISST